MVLPSLEIAGPGGHWVEVSRAICPGTPSAESQQMLEAYEEYYAAAQDSAPGRRHGARRPIGRSQRGSPSETSSSATSPAIRSG